MYFEEYLLSFCSISVCGLQIITSVLESCQGDLDEALEKLTELSLTTNSSPTAENAGAFGSPAFSIWHGQQSIHAISTYAPEQPQLHAAYYIDTNVACSCAINLLVAVL